MSCCNRTLFRKKRSTRRHLENNPPIAASNQLYNMVGFTRNSTDPSRDIHSIQQLPAAEPEVNIYSDIVYIDTTLPKGNQGSLMASANPYWVSEPVQTSSLVAMKSSMQSEATEETIYQNTDAKEHPGKEFDQDESYLTPCEGEMKMERVYQNVDTSL
ncbi:uncharacterized protein LOC112560622 [Pomacea canaliculata]|uniref:uncharacterized protein LOC112560622 n=1 Tax=Pomacea canaliculata TaxID=400727 RepID=UPI000D729D47|nr:uncharacterized protein LOC112560622 [Pomacea canaliculata]